MPLLLAIDGHDGSGKTTLARALAETIGAVYLRPFAGSVGAQFLAEAENGNYDTAWILAETAVGDLLLQHQSARTIVFDRCWLTLFSVVPDRYFARWQLPVPTAVCWCDLPTTLARLAGRRERSRPEAWHSHYLDSYLALAQRYDCLLIDTTRRAPDESLALLLRWAEQWEEARSDSRSPDRTSTRD